MKFPYGEDVNYWQSSQTAPDTWVERTKKVLTGFGGKVEQEAFGSEPQTGRATFMLQFSVQGERFKILWPVLPTRGGNEKAARIQAATMMYHDAKAKALAASVFGARTAFFQHLLLPDGRTAGQLASPELTEALPQIVHPRLGHE